MTEVVGSLAVVYSLGMVVGSLVAEDSLVAVDKLARLAEDNPQLVDTVVVYPP